MEHIYGTCMKIYGSFQFQCPKFNFFHIYSTIISYKRTSAGCIFSGTSFRKRPLARFLKNQHCAQRVNCGSKLWVSTTGRSCSATFMENGHPPIDWIVLHQERQNHQGVTLLMCTFPSFWPIPKWIRKACSSRKWIGNIEFQQEKRQTTWRLTCEESKSTRSLLS